MLIPESLLEARYQGVTDLDYEKMLREVRNYAQDKTSQGRPQGRRDGPTPMDIGAMVRAAGKG